MDNFPALAGIAGSSFILALSGALMPGPLFTLTVAEAARRGTRAGPMIITGHGLLELLLVVAVIKGLGPFLKEPPVIGTIALLGGIILLVMGIDMARKAGSLSLEQDILSNQVRRTGENSPWPTMPLPWPPTPMVLWLSGSKQPFPT